MQGLSGFPFKKGLDIPSIPVSILGKIQSILWESLADSYAPEWKIYYASVDSDGNVGEYSEITYVASILKIETEVNATIPTYPEQKGSFASYNKVLSPRTITCRVLAINENKTVMAEALKKAVNEHENRWKVATPNDVFENLQLTSYTVEHNSEDGSASLLIAELTFTEIRELEVDYYKAGELQADTTKSEKAEDKPTKPTTFVDTVLYKVKNIRSSIQGQIDKTIVQTEDFIARIRKETFNV